MSGNSILVILDGESVEDFERRAAKSYPGEWIVMAGEPLKVVCHSSDEEVASQTYHTVEGSGIQPPDYNPPSLGVIRARC